METKMVVEDDLSAQAKMWNYIYGFSETLVLRCAIELDIANIIHNHGKPVSLSDLALKLPVQPVNSDNLHRLMRHLVHMKLFTKVMVDGETKYGLEPVAKFLVKGFDKCMADGILLITDKDFMAPWHYIKDGITGDSKSTPFNKALGMDLWTYAEKHPGKSQLFNEALACDTRLVISTLVNECKDKFTGIKSLVDVGGGTGTAVMSIAKAFPHIKGTVYDLPHVIADSLVYPEINHVAGDMFKYIPNADAILLKYILHDWGDEECIQILKKCKEAVPKDGGKVIIMDIVLNVESDHPFTKMRLTSDLDMLVNTEGKERTEEEWKKLFQAAGFRSYNITETSAIPSVIEAFPY